MTNKTHHYLNFDLCRTHKPQVPKYLASRKKLRPATQGVMGEKKKIQSPDNCLNLNSLFDGIFHYAILWHHSPITHG